jgi:hypothetical protein
MSSQIQLFFLLAAGAGALTVISLHMIDAVEELMLESKVLIPLVLDDHVYRPERLLNK